MKLKVKGCQLLKVVNLGLAPWLVSSPTSSEERETASEDTDHGMRIKKLICHGRCPLISQRTSTPWPVLTDQSETIKMHCSMVGVLTDRLFLPFNQLHSVVEGFLTDCLSFRIW